MAIAPHPELTYSFRRARPVIKDITDDNRTLAVVEQLLISAGDRYRARHYHDAIDAYQQARDLLWSQLFPWSELIETVAWNVDLQPTLFSYSAEWLNRLPIEQLSTGVRPRELADIGPGPIFGLTSTNVDYKGIGAVADLDFSTMLSTRGNTASAQFFRRRAIAQAPELVRQIEAGVRLAVGTAPAAPSTARLSLAPTLSAVLHEQDSAGAPAANATGQLAPPGAVAADHQAMLGELAALFTTRPKPLAVPATLTVAKRVYSVKVGQQVEQMSWAAGESLAIDTVANNIYGARRALTQLPDILIAPLHVADVAVGLAHAWYYETPLGLAECYHAMGDWVNAELWYLRAAGYSYLNAAIEAPYVWSRLAGLYLDWGNALFRDDDPVAALPIYEKALLADGKAPATPLYTLAPLAPATAAARNVIDHLAHPAAITASPAISAVLFELQAQLAKISGGLDFWGHWSHNVPIWSFDYLQSVAANFCQLAISAERDAISFWEKADSGELTRLQLAQGVAQSKAERDAVQRQVEAAQAELGVYQAGQALAVQRAAAARANASDYAAKSAGWIMHQAMAAQLGGGEDGDSTQLNQLADRMMQGGYTLEGDRGTLTAAEQLTASRLQNQYEMDRMEREALDLDATVLQVEQETKAAGARLAASQASANAAQVRVAGAQAVLSAFDQQRFTPDVWYTLGTKMSHISQRYLGMALDVAKRMQRAYNFENDVRRAIVKPDYSSDAVNGLLAADTLMADVQSFTYDLITSATAKEQPVRQTISLAQRYPFLFETALRATGRMQFQTNLDDFDAVYPGTYAGRIEQVEVSVDGIVPAQGISGTLTNAGISHFRTPPPWAPGSDGVKHRVQPRDVLVLSDYDLRGDALLVDSDRRKRRVFEGAGLASSWTLDLPKAVNRFDYQALLDVRLTFTYRTRYSPELRETVLAELATRPQALQRQRPVPLRWLFPDAFFSFYDSGVLAFSLGRPDFGAAETDPRLVELSLLVVTSPRARAGAIALTVSAPGHAPLAVTTGADGSVAVSQLAALADGASALGEYRITLAAADNPDWVKDGVLDLAAIDNIALILAYSFTPRA
ncbi:MAG: hypothetical protein V4754_13835 [Pseudomonadota bacterium]